MKMGKFNSTSPMKLYSLDRLATFVSPKHINFLGTKQNHKIMIYKEIRKTKIREYEPKKTCKLSCKTKQG